MSSLTGNIYFSRDKKLMEAGMGETGWGKLGLVLISRAMLSNL